MRSTMRVAHNVRLAAILAVGAFALHQLRYLIAPGASSSAALSSHGYMTDLMAPIAVLVLAAAMATLIRGTEGALPARAPLGRRIAVFALALLAIYVGQESLETFLTSGQPASLAEMLGTGGWVAPPLTLVLGALGALLARALEVVELAIAVTHAERRKRTRPPAVSGRALAARALRLASAPLAFGLARRPPPPAPA
jgi:hypothetical protein